MDLNRTETLTLTLIFVIFFPLQKQSLRTSIREGSLPFKSFFKENISSYFLRNNWDRFYISHKLDTYERISKKSLCSVCLEARKKSFV